MTEEEGPAEDYAEKQYADYVPKGYKIYLTGHSLGGYLAQIAAGALVIDHGGTQIGGVEYFNDIGLNYGSAFQDLTTISNEDPTPIINTTAQKEYISAIQKYKSEGGTVLCHRIYGDSISLLGEQTGDIRGPYKTDDSCLENHLDLNGKGPDAKLGAFSFIMKPIFGTSEIGDAVNYYNQRLKQRGKGELAFWSFVWSVHETDGFFYNLGREDPGY